ncbi:sodium/bile acid cotransporter 7-B-like isoform X2 [Gryllus bimaculatus]|nr:sodium/bile acid cotransporter 7-B-like isoform X2 [Gryllus bimaculatus]
MKPAKRNPFLLWKSHLFLVAIFFVIILAEINPKLGEKGGILRPEITVEYGAVSTIFLISGMSMKLEDVFNAAKHYDLHIFVQTFSLFFVPIFVKFLTVCLYQFNVDEWILKGLIVVSCMPPSYSSVVMARAVGGNEPAAVFSSILGSVLGIFTTPFTLLFFLHATALVPPFSTIIDLILTVTLPLAVGIIFHKVTSLRIPNKCMERIGEFALLLLIYTTFCDMFIAHENVALQPMSVVLTIFLGIPILRILYAGYNHLFAISLPLMVYYPIQVILGGLLAGELQSGQNPEFYRDRKGNFSINIRTIANAKLMIMDIVARWPDSCQDPAIFNTSFIKQRLLDKEFGENFILGDKRYENNNFLLTPLHNPSTGAENVCNKSHIKTRNVVERSDGV